MQIMWDTLFNDIPQEITATSAIYWLVSFSSIHLISITTFFIQAMQCISNSWQSPFGSMAIIVLIVFFNSNMEQYPTNEIQQEWAAWYLENFCFAYKDSDGDDKLVCAILFHCMVTNMFQSFRGMSKGPLVLQAFGAHWTVVVGAWKIEGIDDLNPPVGKPVGGLGLATAVVSTFIPHQFVLTHFTTDRLNALLPWSAMAL